MESVLLLGVCAVAWLAWLPAVLAEKEARGEKPSTSIMPIIPFFPLVAWLGGLGLNALQASLGTYLVGGLHAIYRFTTVESGMTFDVYWSPACPRCPMKAQCTITDYRRIRRWKHEAVRNSGSIVSQS